MLCSPTTQSWVFVPKIRREGAGSGLPEPFPAMWGSLERSYKANEEVLVPAGEGWVPPDPRMALGAGLGAGLFCFPPNNSL